MILFEIRYIRIPTFILLEYHLVCACWPIQNKKSQVVLLLPKGLNQVEQILKASIHELLN